MIFYEKPIIWKSHGFFLNRNSFYFPIVLECTFEIEVTWHRSNTLLTNFKIRIHVCTNWYILSTNLRIWKSIENRDYEKHKTVVPPDPYITSCSNCQPKKQSRDVWLIALVKNVLKIISLYAIILLTW